MMRVYHTRLTGAAIVGLILGSVACGSTLIVGNDPNTGLIVSVRKGPIQPVAREGEDNTAPVPDATVAIRLLATDNRLTVTTGADGRISALLQPGSYEVRVTDCPLTLALPPADTAFVVRGGFALVSLECDTGIR